MFDSLGRIELARDPVSQIQNLFNVNDLVFGVEGLSG